MDADSENYVLRCADATTEQLWLIQTDETLVYSYLLVEYNESVSQLSLQFIDSRAEKCP